MLSVSACSTSMAGSYFTDAEENYYIRDQSAADEWQGELCKKISLEDGGAVKAEDFQTILSARESKCAGYDLTFSAPKSVSILSQIGSEQARRDMEEAHRAAVTDTLKEIEKNEIYTRVTINGEVMPIKTGEMAAAKFEHNLSRNTDPQLHTHAFIANMTDYKGKLYAVDGSRLYQVQKIYGAEYRARLAENLREKGYEITITDREKGFFELQGMEKADLEIFSSRRAEILADMKQRGVAGAAEAQLSTLGTRQTKEKNVDQNKLREKWKEIWGERPLAERSASALPDQNKAAAQRAAYAEAIEKLEAQSYAWTKKEFEQEITARGVGCGMTRERAAELIRGDPTILQGTLKLEAGEPQQYFTTIKNYEQERGLFESVAEGRGSFAAALNHKTTEARRQEVCKENGWELTEQQKNLVYHIAESRDQIIAVRGLAGVGKSFSLNAAREVLEKEGFEVMGAAPSGQAAKELAEDARLEGQTASGETRCGTLQRILNEAERNAGNALPGQDYENKRSWNFDNIKAPAKPRIYFLDEAGMIDNNSLSEFFKMAEAQREAGQEIKIVLVGDDRQLPPVGAGNFFSDVIQKEGIATVELTDIRRQKEAPELLQAVREAVQGSPDRAIEILADRKEIHEIKTPKGRISAITREYMSMSEADRAGTLILSAKNADRIKINNLIREQLVKAGTLEKGQEYKIETKKGAEKRNFATGDKIIFLKNDLQLGVRNGTQGTIQAIRGNNFSVDIGKGKIVELDIRKYNRLDHAYCVTTYKSQGATVQRVIINMNSNDKALNSRNSFYVNISRAKSKVSLYCDSKAKIGKQVQKFAKKLTAKSFNFTKAATTGKGLGQSVKGLSELVPPIPLLKPLLKVATKAAEMALKAVELAIKPVEMTAGAGQQRERERTIY